jgi:hypothetical protein
VPPVVHVEGGWRDHGASAAHTPLVRHDCEPAMVIPLMSLILADAGCAGTSRLGSHALRGRLEDATELRAAGPRRCKHLPRQTSGTASGVHSTSPYSLGTPQHVAPQAISLEQRFLPPQEDDANTMFGLSDGNLLLSLREAAGDLEAAARWIGDQARLMIAILDVEGGHIGAEIMRQYNM